MTKREMMEQLKRIADETDYEAMDEILIEAFQATWNDDEQLVSKLGDVLIDCGTYTDKSNDFLQGYFNSYGIELVY